MLLGAGMPLKEALIMLENTKNQEVLEFITSKLSHGESAETFLPNLLPQTYRADFEAFLGFLSLPQALSLSNQLAQQRIQIQSQQRKVLGYPCLMFCGSLIGLLLFQFFCFPALISMVKSFGGQQTMMEVAQLLLTGFLWIIAILLLLFVALIIYLRNPTHQLLSYIFLVTHHKAGQIRRWLSLDFSRYYYYCSKAGCSTQKTLQILQSLRQKQFVKLMSYHVEQVLLKGETFQDALKVEYLDPSLMRFMKIACYSGQVNELMEGYIHLQTHKQQQFELKLARLIQLFAYLLISLIIILVYQILMFPMAMMGNL